MATQPVPKHDPDRRDDRHDDRRDDRSDARREAKVVGEEGALVMPLAEPGPGEPLVGARSVNDEWIPDGERDPHTIAEEQRIRSAADEAGLDPEAELEAARSGDGAPPRRVAHQRKDDPYTQQHTGAEGQQQHQGKSHDDKKDAEKRDAEIHKSAPPPHPSKK